MPSARLQPIIARTCSIRVPIAPVAHDCVKLIFVRAGSAIVLSEFGEKPVCAGDVVALGCQHPCGGEPEDLVTVTTLYLDRDYVVDQVFWQHAELLADRLDAHDFADEIYSESAQIPASERTALGCSRHSWTSWSRSVLTDRAPRGLPDAGPVLCRARCREPVCEDPSPYHEPRPRRGRVVLAHHVTGGSRPCGPRLAKRSTCFAMHRPRTGHSVDSPPEYIYRPHSSGGSSWTLTARPP